MDFRNGYITMKRLATRYPNNPYLLSRIGRLCLEAGRKQEALEYFNQINKMITKPPSSEGQDLDALLGTSNNDKDLEVLSVMNM